MIDVGALRTYADTAAYLTAWQAVRMLPEALAAAGFRGVADEAWRRRGRGVRQLERNLARVTGADPEGAGVRRLSREAMRSYARYWLEVFRLPAMDAAAIRARVRIDGWHRVTDAVRERGAVVALPHMGNWDLAGAWAAVQGVPVTAVAERLEPVAVYDRFVAFRRAIGIEVLGLGDADLVTALVDRAVRHRLVALVADRDLGRGGVEVDFCGEPARMPAGPATVALRAGVPLLPVTLWYEDRLAIRVHEAVPVPAVGPERERAEQMTRAVAGVFTTGVRAHPRDWHMLQRFWLADRPGARQRAEAGG
ncbi:MAG TPA: phosphatidylinositol mannoside acyltransferase [Streptosporangiales bacterium]